MVTSNVYLRTFFIKALEYGTAFTIEVAGQEYLITARHLLDRSEDWLPIEIYLNGVWNKVRANVVGHCAGEADITVLRLPHRLTDSTYKLPPTAAHIVIGQDVYFLGYPYKLWGNSPETMPGRPVAFVKKGTLSNIDFAHSHEFYVDAINNAGFSGGPLVFATPENPNEFRIAAVVSKFRTEYERVEFVDGELTELQVPYNTGFLVAYGIKNAIDLIERQGTGG